MSSPAIFDELETRLRQLAFNPRTDSNAKICRSTPRIVLTAALSNTPRLAPATENLCSNIPFWSRSKRSARKSAYKEHRRARASVSETASHECALPNITRQKRLPGVESQFGAGVSGVRFTGLGSLGLARQGRRVPRCRLIDEGNGAGPRVMLLR